MVSGDSRTDNFRRFQQGRFGGIGKKHENKKILNFRSQIPIKQDVYYENRKLNDDFLRENTVIKFKKLMLVAALSITLTGCYPTSARETSSRESGSVGSETEANAAESGKILSSN